MRSNRRSFLWLLDSRERPILQPFHEIGEIISGFLVSRCRLESNVHEFHEFLSLLLEFELWSLNHG